MIRRPPRSTQSRSSAASDVYKRQVRAALPFSAACDKDDEEKARQQFYPSKVSSELHLPERPETIGSQFSGLSDLKEMEPFQGWLDGPDAGSVDYLPMVIGTRNADVRHASPIVWH
eukprot:TRINITY_DN2846_c0_g1_i1.p1 TRINITY_DN2846_c0_g1~~TRINITY_DN2846_c0_g1_i1.p1  ORF type:complete len:116 (-),score=41.44 TRINITY_DN2846_c0_g1_i1:192-539(-)